MVRSDHSMRPPTPRTTLAFHSPNACNLCHQDKDAAWSERAVRNWHARDYQALVLRRGSLVAAARKKDWSQLPAMLAEVVGTGRNEVLAVALLRLLRSCSSDDKWPAVLAAMQDRSPWVRAAAAEASGEHLSPEVTTALLKATRDPVRLPRVRAANALAALPPSAVPREFLADLEAATRELEVSMTTRPDDFASQYSLGQLFASRGDRPTLSLPMRPPFDCGRICRIPGQRVALQCCRQEPRRRNCPARRARPRPGNAAAHLNLGMLLGELGRLPEAEAALRAAAREDPRSAQAAYNLSVLFSRDHRPGVTWSRRASEIDPASSKYAYTWAFYLARRGDQQPAIAVLRLAIAGKAVSRENYAFLSKLLAETGHTAEAETVLRRAAADPRLGPTNGSPSGAAKAPVRPAGGAH